MLTPRTSRRLTLQQQRDMLTGNVPENLLFGEPGITNTPAGVTGNGFQSLFNKSPQMSNSGEPNILQNIGIPSVEAPSTNQSNPNEPQSLQDIDTMYQNGEISKEQADQYELLFSNQRESDISNPNIDDKGRLLSSDTSGYADPSNPFTFPLFNSAGSDLSTELYSLGMGIGAEPGTKGRGATIAGSAGAAALDIAGTVLSGVGFSKRNRFLEEEERRKQQEVNYTPNSQTANSNTTGGLSYGEYGGLFYPSKNTPKYQDGGTTGNTTPSQRFYTYPGKPDAVYKKVDNKWFISPKGELGDESFVPVQDPLGSRYKELNSHAVTFKSQTYQTSDIRDSLGQDPGDDYLKKHPPIYVSNNKDPRIGTYNEAGNIFLYKKPVQEVSYPKKVEASKVIEPGQPIEQQLELNIQDKNTNQALNSQSETRPDSIPEDKIAYRTQWTRDEKGNLFAKQVPYAVQKSGKGEYILLENREPGYKKSFAEGGEYRDLFNTSENIPKYPDGGVSSDPPVKSSEWNMSNMITDPAVIEQFKKDHGISVPGGSNLWLDDETGAYTFFTPLPTEVQKGNYRPPVSKMKAPVVPVRSGMYKSANTGQPLPDRGSPGQVDYQYAQFLDEFASSPEMVTARNSQQSDIERNKALLQTMSEEQKADMRSKKMTPSQYLSPASGTPTFKDGGIFGKKVGDPIKFNYGGEMISGKIKKIENGQIYLE